MPKILIIGSHCEQLLNFRGDLMRHLQAHGHEVVAASPPGAADVDRRLASWGVRRYDLAMDRASVNVRGDLRLLAQLRRLVADEQPDVVLAYTIKPVIYGALASRWAGRPAMVAMITGLGAAFLAHASMRQRLVRWFARSLYRVAIPQVDTVVFQNPDDEADFRRYRLLAADARVAQVAGSGVNLERFPQVPLPTGQRRFLMVARLLADKGVREYIAAAAELRRRHPDVECHLLGPLDPNPSGLSQDEVDAAVRAGSIVYTGFTRDVRPHLAACHVFVLPSYREGTPRSVLEALATGRPVICTDAPGCRETVVDGRNGLLVPPREVPPLAAAMDRMAAMSTDELARMGDASRRMAVDRFDVAKVNEQIARICEEAIAARTSTASLVRAPRR